MEAVTCPVTQPFPQWDPGFLLTAYSNCGNWGWSFPRNCSQGGVVIPTQQQNHMQLLAQSAPEITETFARLGFSEHQFSYTGLVFIARCYKDKPERVWVASWGYANEWHDRAMRKSRTLHLGSCWGAGSKEASLRLESVTDPWSQPSVCWVRWAQAVHLKHHHESSDALRANPGTSRVSSSMCISE